MMLCATSNAALRDALGEDGILRDVEVKYSILLEDLLELSQDLKRHALRGPPAVRLFCPS